MMKKILYVAIFCLNLIGCDAEVTPHDQHLLSDRHIIAADLSSDSRFAIISTLQRGMELWDLDKRQLRWHWRHGELTNDTPTVVRFSPDISHAITATDRDFVIWSVSNGHSLGYYALTESRIRDIAISATSRYILVGRQDGRGEWIDTTTGRRLHFLGHSAQINTVDLSGNGRFALTGGSDYTAYLWDTQTGQVIWRFNHGKRVVIVKFDSQGRYAFTADSSRGSIWDLTSGKEVSRLQLSSRNAIYTNARFVNNGEWLITTGPARQLSLWQVKDGSLLQNWQVSPSSNTKSQSSVVYSAALRDNSHIVTISSSALAETWVINEGSVN